ncbi:flagella synthesis protein FlgN [Thiomicrospira sp. S5]|uniref:flagella synthesis protein FlgN n=1 Tax=Thiomicrospira sp. S5 TaxID=1803865 RepID=UPI000F8A18D1|nr:flagellar protein FlgN [Thiomicrospira sp. S5]AZR81866.1 hypothetical protein AYJ59_05975 [Thiomicrospira sp. S5]
MSQVADTQTLSPLLSELLDLLSKFETALEDEAAVLKSPDISSLSEILQQKETLSEAVTEKFDQLTHTLLTHDQDARISLDNLSLLEIPGLTDSNKQSLKKISEKAKQCHKLNAVNGMTVQALRNLNQTTINLLTGRDENGKTYSASGKTLPSDQKSNPLGKA